MLCSSKLRVCIRLSDTCLWRWNSGFPRLAGVKAAVCRVYYIAQKQTRFAWTSFCAISFCRQRLNSCTARHNSFLHHRQVPDSRIHTRNLTNLIIAFFKWELKGKFGESVAERRAVLWIFLAKYSMI